MNKQEFLTATSTYSNVYCSRVVQYADTTNNITYLIFASREKNHIYITRNSRAIKYVSLNFGGVAMNNILPNASGSELFVDISEIIQSFARSSFDLTVLIRNPDFPETRTFRVIVAEGYRFDNLAQNLEIAQNRSCGKASRATMQYNTERTLSFIFPPTTILTPIYEDGQYTIFRNIPEIILPVYRSNFSPTSINIYTTDVVASVANNFSPLKLSINNLITYGRLPAVIRNDDYVMDYANLRPLSYTSNYVCLRWQVPYIPPMYFASASGGAINAYNYTGKITAQAFFEVIGKQEETNIIDLEDSASYMPFKSNVKKTISVGLRNITAYDYIYYSQIFLSENIEILQAQNFGSSSIYEINFQPAKVEKQKITMPLNGGQMYDLEIKLILSEND